MLTLVPNSWLTQVSQMWNLSGSTVTVFGSSYENTEPLRVSFKPLDGRKNFMGNRETNHLQTHGSCLINNAGWVTRPFPHAVYGYPSAVRTEAIVPYFWSGRPSSTGTGAIILAPGYDEFVEGYQASAIHAKWDYKYHDGRDFAYCDGTPQKGPVYYDNRLKKYYMSVWINSWNRFGTYIRNAKPYQHFHYVSKTISFSYTPSAISLWDGCEPNVTTAKANGQCQISWKFYASRSEDFEDQSLLQKLSQSMFEEWKLFIQRCKALYRVSSRDLTLLAIAPWNYGEITTSYDFHVNWKYIMRWKDAIRDVGLATEPSIDRNVLLGDATQSAADAALKFTGNTATLVKELFELKSTILDLWKLLQGDVSPKSLANLWLSGRYGLRLTYQDTLDLAESILEEAHESDHGPYSWSRGGASSDGNIAHCKLYFDPNTRNLLAKGVSWLMEWDLFPSLANVWDIIPYSFVVDWFVDVEGYLSAIDSNTQLSVMEVFSTVYSLKKQWEPSTHAPLGLVGQLSYSRYERVCPTEPFQVVPSFSGNLPSNKNIIDGSALIIQHLKS